MEQIHELDPGLLRRRRSGLHHVVRPEDFPVQPCMSAGFALMPSGFFNLNPSNDVPETMNHTSVLANGEVACDC